LIKDEALDADNVFATKLAGKNDEKSKFCFGDYEAFCSV